MFERAQLFMCNVNIILKKKLKKKKKDEFRHDGVRYWSG